MNAPHDLNDYARISGHDVDQFAQDFDPSEAQFIQSAAEFGADLSARLFGPKVPKIPGTPFPNLAGDLEFRPGELTVWGGYNGHRKSMVLGQLALWWMTTGSKVCMASFEMQPIVTLERMLFQAARNMHPSQDYLTDWMMWLIGKLWMYDQQGSVAPQRVLNLARYFGTVMRGQHLVIDSLMKCGMAEDDHARIQWFVNELTSVAADTGLHIHLVHHVKKPADDESKLPGKYDLKGTGNIADQAHNIVLVWQDKKRQQDPDTPPEEPNALLLVVKQRNGEFEGKVRLKFDRRSMHHLEYGQRVPFDWKTHG